MKRTYRTIWIAALLMLAACSNEEVLTLDNPDRGNGGQRVTVTATLPGNDSRVALEEVTENGKNIIKVDWAESGETFTVMTTQPHTVTSEENDGGNVFTQTSGDQFEGTLPEKVTGQPYYAIYPALNMYFDYGEENKGYNYGDDVTQEPITSFSASKVPFSLGFSQGLQTGKLEGNFIPPMYATSEDGEQFDFHHLIAIVKFTLTGLPTASSDLTFKISWQGGNQPFGTFDLTKSPVSAMYPTASESQECSVRVLARNENGTTEFYAYLPPVAQGKTLEISCFKRKDDKIIDYTAHMQLTEKSIEAGKYYRATREVTKKEISTSMTAGTVQELQTWVNAFINYRGSINLTLTADIDLTNADLDSDNTNQSNWPVGLDLANTTIDGGGHILTGLKMVDLSGEGESAAMFRSIDETSTVKNLHLRDVELTSSSYFAAGVVADNLGTVSGCSVSGTIRSTAEGYSAGGVVADNKGTVTACYSSATVSATGQNGFAGGVVGNNSSLEINSSSYKNGTVTACYSTGAVSATGTNGSAGGVVGYNNSGSTVNACYWSGTGVTNGIGYDHNTNSSSNKNAAPVTDDSWATTVLNAMNTALPTNFGWEYQANTDDGTKEAFPLVLEKEATVKT